MSKILVHLNLPGTSAGIAATREILAVTREMPGATIRHAGRSVAGCDMIVALTARDHAAANGRAVDLIDAAHSVAGAYGCHREAHTRSKLIG